MLFEHCHGSLNHCSNVFEAYAGVSHSCRLQMFEHCHGGLLHWSNVFDPYACELPSQMGENAHLSYNPMQNWVADGADQGNDCGWRSGKMCHVCPTLLPVPLQALLRQ